MIDRAECERRAREIRKRCVGVTGYVHSSEYMEGAIADAIQQAVRETAAGCAGIASKRAAWLRSNSVAGQMVAEICAGACDQIADEIRVDFGIEEPK